MAAKIKILMTLGKYYESAMRYFQKNIEWAYEQNISGEYVNKSMDMFMKMLFLRANSVEKVGVILKASPVPRDLSPEEKKAYSEVLEEKALEAMDKALPLYEDAVKTAQQLGIATSSWLERAKERIREINPSSPALTIEITPHQYKPTQVAAAAPAGGYDDGTDKGMTGSATMDDEGAGINASATTFRDEAYARNMKRIQNIIQMDLPVDDKIKQLKRIETEANREIQEEEEKIQELKKKL